MDKQDDHDAFSTRWRLMLIDGHLPNILTEVNAQLVDATPSDRPFLLRWQATARNHLGEHIAAMESARLALEIGTGDADPQTAALIYANIGTAYLGLGKHDKAVASFEMAELLLRELGDEWMLGAVLVNHAACEISRHSNNAGIALLDEAAICQPMSKTDLKEQSYRAVTIRINRSIAFFQSARTKESVDELLRARQETFPTGNLKLLGSVDFNLARAYERLHLYSSMLEAAESAAQMHHKTGNIRGARQARALVAAALANLGKRQRAKDLVDELLSSAQDDEIEEVRANLASVAWTFRYHGWGDISGIPAGRYGGMPDQKVAIFDRLQELRDQNYAGDAYSESEDLLAQLEASGDHPATRLMVEFERALRNAILNPESSELLSPEISQELEEITGRGIRNMAAIVQGFAADEAGATAKQLEAWLEILWNRLDSWHDQHDEEYRSDYLSGHGHIELATCLDLAVEAGRPDVIMEVIEVVRIDTSSAGSPRASLGLAPYYQVASTDLYSSHRGNSGSGLTHPVRYLADPRPVAIRGRSAMAEVASSIQQPVDLDRLRVMMAGPDSLWWSCSVQDHTLFWALLTPDGVLGGKRELPAPFAAAVEAHLRSLPVILESDLALSGSLAAPATVRLIALARSASSAMLNRPALRDAALAALPSDRRSSVRDYCAGATQIDLKAAYELMAQVLVPDELRQTLLTSGNTCRLIATLPPELATLPISLLPVSTDAVVLDHANVQFSPPAGLAAGLSGRAYAQVPRPHLLAIADTAGDLPAAYTRPSPPATVLTGWSSAHEVDEVATREQVERHLRYGGWVGGSPGVLSYTGHLVPGDRDHPGSAALVCAQANAEGPPDLLTASEILSWQDSCFPSHVYLGGCEGTGFGTGLEWASLAAAALSRGAACVLSHAWPIVDGSDMAKVDTACMTILTNAGDVGQMLGDIQRSWLDQWRQGNPDAIPPHFWAGLQLIGSAGLPAGAISGE